MPVAEDMQAGIFHQFLMDSSVDQGHQRIIVAEGLTDFLALSFTSPVPVLVVPGVSGAQRAITRWVRGRRLVVATDADAAGDNISEVIAARADAGSTERVVRLRWPRGVKDACEALALLGEDAFAAWLEDVIENFR